MANFAQRFGFPNANAEPDIDMSRTGGNPYDILRILLAQGQPPIAGPRPPQQPQRLASQQPTIPIQTAQGAPQSPTQQPQPAPNSGMIGASPYANQALTGGSGMPIGGLPTQSPALDFSSPQQVAPHQMQLQQLRMANAPRIQQFMQLMARLRQQVPTLGLS